MFPPVNQTILLNYWKSQRKLLGISKSHINITKQTIIALPVTTLKQITAMQLTQTNINAKLTTLMIKLMKLLVKHVSKNTKAELEGIKDPNDSNNLDSNLDSSSDSK